MKQTKILFIAFLSLFIFSCSNKQNDLNKNKSLELKKNIKKKTKDYQIYNNTNIPSNKNFSYSIEEMFSIIGTKQAKDSAYFTFPMAFDIDSNENIFLLDGKKSTVFKFDEIGKFINKFGRIGNGPGEINGPSFFCIVNDMIFYGGGSSQKILKYENNGNFVKSIPIPLSNGIPEYVSKINKDRIVSQVITPIKSNNSFVMSLSVAILNNKFELLHILNDNREIVTKKRGLDYTNTRNIFTFSNDKIYVAHNSDKDYIIDVYNFSGKLEATIKKYYRKLLFKHNKLKVKQKRHKKVITGLFYDKKRDLLLVKKSVERNKENKGLLILDVFKNNKYINTIDLDIGKGLDFFNPYSQIRIINNKIYHLSIPEAKLTIYKIKG